MAGNINKELDQLFQKFIDKTLGEDELDKFQTLLRDNKNDIHVQEILSELWDYIESASVEPNSKDNILLNKLIKDIQWEEADYDFYIKKIKRKKENKSKKEENSFIEFEIELPENISDEEAIEIIKQTALLADNYHRSLGGSGLKINDIQIEESIFHLDPVES